MKLAVFGKSGQLSQALQGLVGKTENEAVFYSRQDCNLAHPTTLVRQFADSMPDVDAVVLAAAYTGVVQAEDDRETAFAVNAQAPEIIAKVCKKRAIPLIYISTDYVFDGMENAPYKTDHLPNPINVYGQSKRAGEVAIRDSGCPFAVLRTSWLFNGQGLNFMTSMLKREENGKRIKVVGDQIGRPTYLGHLAKAVLDVSEQMSENALEKSGIYHVTNTGDPVSWAEFAREIFKKSGTNLVSPVVIDEILTKEYEMKVARPPYSVLDVSSFEKTFGLKMPDWRDGLALALAEWRNRAG